MKVCLDLHDFSICNGRYNYLLALKQCLPNLKVSLFTLPDARSDWGPYLVRPDMLEFVKQNLEWLQLIPHGLTHSRKGLVTETYSHFKYTTLPEIERFFKDDDLPLVKGLCAPHWRWNDDVVKVLNEEGWWGAVHRDKVAPTPKRFYRYSHLLNEVWDPQTETLKLHGHIYGTKNDIALCLPNLVNNIPLDAEWHFVTDFIETNETV